MRAIISVAMVILALVAVPTAFYFALRLKRVKRNHAAVISLREKPQRVEGPGYILLKGGEAIRVYPAKSWPEELPAKREKIQENNDIPLEKGMVRPFRVNHEVYDQALFFSDPPTRKELRDGPGLTFAALKKVNKKRAEAIEKDLLQTRIASSVTFLVVWRIEALDKNNKPIQKKLFAFEKNVGSIKNAKKRIDVISRSILQEILGKMTHGEALRMKDELGDIFQKKLEAAVQEGKLPRKSKNGPPLGIMIDNAEILELDPGHKINSAQADGAVAQEENRRSIMKASTDAENTLVAARAKAEAITLTATADTEAMTKKADVLEREGAQIALGADVLKEGLKGAAFVSASQLILMADGGRGFKEIVNPSSPTQKPKTQKSTAPVP